MLANDLQKAPGGSGAVREVEWSVWLGELLTPFKLGQVTTP
jgi:hypothetical protein